MSHKAYFFAPCVVEIRNADSDNPAVCAGLVRYDRNSGVIRLCHKSAEDYLRRRRVARFPTAARDIAKNCITCLLYRDYQQGPVAQEDNIVERILERHLYDYAAVNWGKHVQGAPEEELVGKCTSFLLGVDLCSAHKVERLLNIKATSR